MPPNVSMAQLLLAQQIDANSLETVSSYDTLWQSNSMSPVAFSTDDAIVPVRVFDDGQSDGVGWLQPIPAGIDVATFTFLTRPRGFTAADTTSWQLYKRRIDGTPGAWSLLGSVSHNYTSGAWVNVQIQNVSVVSFAGQVLQLEIIRSGGTLGGAELARVVVS